MQPSVVIKMFPAIKCFNGLLKAIKLSGLQQFSLDNAVVSLYKAVFFWRSYMNKLLIHLLVFEIISNRMSYKLTAVVISKRNGLHSGIVVICGAATISHALYGCATTAPGLRCYGYIHPVLSAVRHFAFVHVCARI